MSYITNESCVSLSSRGDTENTPTRTGMDGSCHRTADNTIKRIQRYSPSVSMDAESKGGNSNQKVPPYRVNTTQRCLDNTEYLYSKLRAVYGECTDKVVREAVVQLNTKYSGYMLYFCDTFLDPALELIKTLKKNFQEPGCPSTFQWPVCCQGSIIIHLQDTKQLLPGQQYIYIRRSSGGQIQLAVKYCSLQGLHDVILRKNNEIANVLNMEWSNRFKMRSDEDLGKLLQRTMVSFEDSIQKIKLEESADSCKDCKRNRQIPDGKKVLSAVTNRSRFSNRPDGYYPQMNNDLQCNQPRSPGFYNHRTLDVPKTIMDLDYDLLQSGIAILPGCRDMRGGAVIFIFTGSSLWKNQQVSSSELARLLLYYRSVPREEVKQKGLTVVADVRGSNSSTINTLLEAIYLLEGNIPNCISSLLCVADLHTEPLVLKSPVYDKKATFKSSVLLSVEQLCDSIELDQLPLIFHGLFVYCHEDWVRFHMKLDPFLSKLRATAKYLICVIQDLSDIDVMPKNFDETTQTIKHHEESVKSALCDQRLISLQSDGKGIISDLQKEEEYMSHTEDYRDCMRTVDQLYIQLQNSMVKLVKLSENRLRKLEKCLHLREFEEESNKVISWLKSHGGQIADRYANLADNLKAIRSQQKDFEKFHFSAMSFIEKGNDLLEEASIFVQSGDFEDATGYKELARTLKKHLQDFTHRLEATRERIESTTKCYHLLDKSYEWALEAMKFVASMKMDHSTTLEGLEKLLRSLELYLRHHPAMTEATFASMSELAQQLQNDKLLEQCRVAKARCVETNNLLNLRLGTLRRAKEKMLREQNLQPSNSFSSPHRSPERTYAKDSNQMSQSYEVGDGGWNPILSSTPAVPNRAIHPAFRKCVSEAAFSPHSGNSFITEDLSDHVVTSIPKVLNDTTLKSSREDLTEDSSESAQNNKNNNTEKLNNSTTNSTDFVFTPPYEPGNTLSSHNRPVKKMLKRTTVNSLDTSGAVQNGHISLQKRTSAPLPSNVIIEEDESKLSPPLRNPHLKTVECRPVSMITVSTDSLSSLPEEEEENQENSCNSPQKRDWSKGVCGSPPTREWTPVPVNSHLSEFNRNVPTGSLAGLKLSGKESKSILAHVMCEMVQTERDYVQSLQYIIENYIPELLREDVPQALRGKRNVIFGNLEKIHQFHYQYFLKEVEMCEQKPFQISHYFLMHESFFYLYALYNKNKPKSDALMAEYGKNFFKQKQEELGDRMDLSSYLLKPVQRMGKYALMLKQIMKECPQSDAAYQDLKAAEQMVKFQLRHGNDLLAMDALKDCDVNLQEQGSLLRQDEFLVWQGRKKSLRHVFLFEDMILFSKTKRNRHGGPEYYVYKNSFKMADIGLTENYGESGYKFEIWFRRRNSGDNYIFQAPNSDVKLHWIRGISKILWNQALKNRDRHMTEMATMGIGNKPCLDIKPSANNIQDRFVNYALGGRGARTRNSIAVSSFDHSRLNNKRPHSIISIGSTSSSNSSHSGLFINPGAGGDPFDSPRHTTNTCLSNESGIGTDVSSSYIDHPSESFHKDMSPTHQYQLHNSPQHSQQYRMASQEIPPLAYSSTDV
ncbi:puratrophin-1-like isoform X2 [Mytilus galloprovincialis]|uniref:puratrophin-1-like isoform X2 n=1 Tax=Mytilus galloprovincialis TaxID=29158 RepID=UPI003F7CCE6D